MRNRLRVLRAERGWSQAELADRLQVSRQTINAIENLRYDPSLPLAFHIARLFGLSRTRAADLAAAGEVSVNAASVGKSHRVSAGDLLEVAIPSGPASPTLEVVAEPVPGMRVVHDDDDIVVVDKPVGVAAHPSVGWTGPNVLAGLKAAGYRISTSGANAGCAVTSSTRSPSIQTSRPSRIDSRYSSPVRIIRGSSMVGSVQAPSAAAAGRSSAPRR